MTAELAFDLDAITLGKRLQRRQAAPRHSDSHPKSPCDGQRIQNRGVFNGPHVPKGLSPVLRKRPAVERREVFAIGRLRAHCSFYHGAKLKPVPLQYMTAEEVRPGDRVLYHGEPGSVETVVTGKDENDEANDWLFQQCGPGCMLLCASFGRVFVNEVEDDEDLDFVARA